MSSDRRRLCWNVVLAGILLGASARAEADDSACTTLLNQANVVIAEAEREHDKGKPHVAERRAGEALDILDRAHSLCPRSRDVCAVGVVAAVYANRWEVGRLWLDRYANLTPYGERDPQLHYLRALVEARLVNRPDLAIRSLERMQALAPFLFPTQRDRLYYEALLSHGNALKQAQRYEDALRHFQTAALVARRSGKPLRARAARVNMAITYLQATKYAEAANEWAELRKEEPDNPIWSYQHGLALANATRFQEAIEAYRHSIARQVGFPAEPEVLEEIQRARLRLGNCLKLRSEQTADPIQREKLLAEGQRELEAYVADHPKDPLGHLWLGVLLYEQRRDFHTAIRHFRESHRLDPVCETALRYLVLSYQWAGGPLKPKGVAPTEEELAAWKAEQARLEKDFEEGKDERKKKLDARAAETGDIHGGCQ